MSFICLCIGGGVGLGFGDIFIRAKLHDIKTGEPRN